MRPICTACVCGGGGLILQKQISWWGSNSCQSNEQKRVLFKLFPHKERNSTLFFNDNYYEWKLFSKLRGKKYLPGFSFVVSSRPRCPAHKTFMLFSWYVSIRFDHNKHIYVYPEHIYCINNSIIVKICFIPVHTYEHMIIYREPTL